MRGEDPSIAEKKVKSRTFNISVVYPPTLVGEYTFRLSEWSSALDLSTDPTQCPIFKLTALDDPFGCSATAHRYHLPTAFDDILMKNGIVDEEVRLNISFGFLLYFRPNAHLLF